jgi:hypothetical protein
MWLRYGGLNFIEEVKIGFEGIEKLKGMITRLAGRPSIFL